MTIKIPKSQTQRRVVIPSDFTLRDLLDGVPIKIWWWLIIGATACFSTGYGAALFVQGELLPTTFTKEVLTNKASASRVDSSMSSFENPADFRISPDLVALRKQDNVRLIDDRHNELTVERMPVARYAFIGTGELTRQYDIEEFKSVHIKVIPNFLAFEIHKVARDDVRLILFFNRQDVSVLEDEKSPRRAFEAFNQFRDNTVPVAIPVESIKAFASRVLPSSQGVLAEFELVRK